MSSLRIITLPAIVAGYRLAGADAHAAETPAEAARLLTHWMAAGAEGLVAVDDRLLDRLDPGLVQQMEAYRRLPMLALPSGEPLPPEVTGRSRIADLVREAVGFHITFAGEGP